MRGIPQSVLDLDLGFAGWLIFPKCIQVELGYFITFNE